MKKYYVLFLLLLSCVQLWAQRPFIGEFVPSTDGFSPRGITIKAYDSPNYNLVWVNTSGLGGNGSANNITGDYFINVGNISGTFDVYITGYYPHIKCPDIWKIKQWGDNPWKSMNYTFYGKTNLIINTWDIPDFSQLTDMSYMFGSCLLFTGHPSMNNWNTANVQNMSSLFYNCKKFNQNINNWNTANVSNMSFMFAHCEDFNQPLNNWNTGNVTNMSWMFDECTNFNQPIGNWDVSKVTNMSYMFYYCSNFNQPLGNWNVGNVTDMSGMFGFSKFNQPINAWNTSNVTKMCDLFLNHYFNQPIDNWDVSKVDCMSGIFGSAFNQPVGNWNTSSLKYIFQIAGNSFNQNLGSWDVSNLILGVQAFDFTSMSMENYDSTLIGWSSQNLRDSVTLGALNKQYCNSVMERKSMIINYKWNFVGDIQSCLTEVEETIESPQISVYPNPNTGNFVIQSIENDRYEIYDVHGKQVSSGKIIVGKNNIQVSLASGLYVIKLLEQQKNIKMVVE